MRRKIEILKIQTIVKFPSFTAPNATILLFLNLIIQQIFKLFPSSLASSMTSTLMLNFLLKSFTVKIKGIRISIPSHHQPLIHFMQFSHSSIDRHILTKRRSERAPKWFQYFNLSPPPSKISGVINFILR